MSIIYIDETLFTCVHIVKCRYIDWTRQYFGR